MMVYTLIPALKLRQEDYEFRLAKKQTNKTPTRKFLRDTNSQLKKGGVVVHTYNPSTRKTETGGS
jgi:hypothetical protein